MLSYQHMYHCGNLADVHKHYILCEILHRLKQKNKPISYIESHAGAGLYDLNSQYAQKTLEYISGINNFEKKLSDSIYIKTLNEIRSVYGTYSYGGSPLFAKHLLDSNDSMNLMELHPAEYDKLKNNLYKFKNIHLHHRDGYEGTLAISPTLIKRGVIFIDPSFEIKEEYYNMDKYILTLHQKWKEAIIILWYPILEDGLHRAFLKSLSKNTLPKLFINEVYFDNISKADNFKLLGSGIMVINFPFGADINVKKLTNLFA